MSQGHHIYAMEKASQITPQLIEKLVYDFYDQIRTDDLLGPVFNAEIDDWDEHLPKMVSFWNSVILKTRTYNGRPVPAHAKLEGLTKGHFDRWLEMFEETANKIFTPENAHEFVSRAHQIAMSLKNAIDVQRGVLPGAPEALSG